MGWEKRGSRKYYYDSVWEDGRVVKKYVGRGDKAKAAAGRVAARQSERAREIAEVEQWTEKLRELDLAISTLCGLAKLHMEAHLLANGYYMASRTWRKKKRS